MGRWFPPWPPALFLCPHGGRTPRRSEAVGAKGWLPCDESTTTRRVLGSFGKTKPTPSAAISAMRVGTVCTATARTPARLPLAVSTDGSCTRRGSVSEWTLYEGDCLEVMRQLPDNSVDAVVTDPPYGLEFMGEEWDKLAVPKPGNLGGFAD